MGDYSNMIQHIKVTANLGKEELSELGRLGPYHRYVTFPIEIKEREGADDVLATLIKEHALLLKTAPVKPPHFHCRKCHAEDFVFMNGVRCCHSCWTKEATPVGMDLCTPAVCASS